MIELRALVIEYVSPAPTAILAAPASVIEYAAPAVADTAPALAIKHVAPSPAATCAAPAPVIEYVTPASNVTCAADFDILMSNTEAVHGMAAMHEAD